MSDIVISTLGYERTTNPMLGIGQNEFIERKQEENIPLPPYFQKMAEQNLNGPPVLEQKHIESMTATLFAEAMTECTVVDTRSPLSYAGGHIKGSYNIWLNGLATFPGWMLDYGKDILLVTERREDVQTARRFLLRIGFDRIRGYLCDGITVWYNSGMQLEQSGIMTAGDLNERLKEEDTFVLDVRSKEEYEQGRIPGAVNIYVGELNDLLAEIPSDRTVVSVCSTGNRSGLGASILMRKGFESVYNLIGGMKAWKAKGYPVEQ